MARFPALGRSCVFGHRSSLSGWFARTALSLSLALLVFFVADSWAGVGGSISGTVSDASGAVVPKATIKATNTDNGVERQAMADDRDSTSFPDLPIGRYDIVIEKPGFKSYRRRGISIDADSALVVDAALEIGGRTEAVTVNESAVHAETSDTQMGEVIRERKWPPCP